MSLKKFLNGAEYASLGLSVVGTIAAATTQQIAYAATPFTLLFSLNLLNRKEELAKSNQRLIQLEQRFSNDFRSISERIQTVQTSPSSPTEIQLQEIKSLVQNNQQEFDRLKIGFRNLKGEINNLPQPSKPIDLTWVEESIEQIVGNIVTIRDSLEKLQNRSKSFVTFESIDRLQEQLNSLTNRLNNQLDNQEIEQLKTKLTRTATLEQLDEIRGDFSKLVTLEILAEFKVEIESIEQQIIEQLHQQRERIKLDLDNLSGSSKLVDLTEIEESISAIQSQLTRPTPTIEQITQIQQEITNLRDELILLEDLEHSASALHDYDLKLRNRIDTLETTLDREVTNVEARVKEYINGFSGDLDKHFANSFQDFSTKIQTINQLLKERLPNYEYELVLNRDGSRQVLLETLTKAKERVILVCPWLSHGIDDKVIELCENLLKRGGKIDIGWGNLGDLPVGSVPHKMSRKDFVKNDYKNWKYGRLERLGELESKYPTQLKIKLLFTHEKFLVCDRAFAMIGSHNFLTSTPRSKEREIGLKTNNLQVIEKLIKHFDDATDYEIKNIDNNFYCRNQNRLPYV
jgi:PLD-like domain